MINGIIVQNDPVNWVDPNGEYATSTTAEGWAWGEAEGAAEGVAGAIGAGVGAGLGVLFYPTDIAPDDLTLPPQMSRKPFDPNKPNRHKQGRENKEKKKGDDWTRRCPPREPPRHTPSRKHR